MGKDSVVVGSGLVEGKGIRWVIRRVIRVIRGLNRVKGIGKYSVRR